MPITRLIATGAVAVAAAIPASAVALSSHAQLFQDPAATADCGIELSATHHSPTELLCSGPGIPAPKHQVGDPFVQISATGAPRTVLISQNSFVSNHLKTLRAGTIWSGLGVTCQIATRTILCFNRDNHGFVIGAKHYESF